jgi:hypothetical protein
MSAGANVRHSLGLLLASVGGVGIVISVGLVAASVNGPGAGMACAAVGALLSIGLAWRGIKMRNRAAKESTIFKEDDGEGPTSVTGKSKLSFRQDKERPRDDDW